MANIPGVAGFLRRAIPRIPREEIDEARSKNYPCVLIVGQRQHLNYIYKALQVDYPGLSFVKAEETSYCLSDGYRLLLTDDRSNLGWRVVAGIDLAKSDLVNAIKSSRDYSPFIDHLPGEFVARHSEVLTILRVDELRDEDIDALESLLGETSVSLVNDFFSVDAPEEVEEDRDQPTVLLSSFEGCKGLSAAHVFIVGLNEGEIPKVAAGEPVSDIEYSKFIVAMTRARKSVSLLSNKWSYAPGGPEALQSRFIEMIPSELRANSGYIRTNQVDTFLEPIWPVRI